MKHAKKPAAPQRKPQHPYAPRGWFSLEARARLVTK